MNTHRKCNDERIDEDRAECMLSDFNNGKFENKTKL